MMIIKAGASVAAVSSKADTQMALTTSSPAGILRGSLLVTFFRSLKVELKCYTNPAPPLSREISLNWCSAHWAHHTPCPLAQRRQIVQPTLPLLLKTFQAVLLFPKWSWRQIVMVVVIACSLRATVWGWHLVNWDPGRRFCTAAGLNQSNTNRTLWICRRTSLSTHQLKNSKGQ